MTTFRELDALRSYPQVFYQRFTSEEVYKKDQQSMTSLTIDPSRFNSSQLDALITVNEMDGNKILLV
jgi:hypothetical protein